MGSSPQAVKTRPGKIPFQAMLISRLYKRVREGIAPELQPFHALAEQINVKNKQLIIKSTLSFADKQMEKK